jgi:hypothetical protein
MVVIWGHGVVGRMATKLKKLQKGRQMEQDIKWLAFNMEKREIKVKQSLMA